VAKSRRLEDNTAECSAGARAFKVERPNLKERGEGQSFLLILALEEHVVHNAVKAQIIL